MSVVNKSYDYFCVIKVSDLRISVLIVKDQTLKLQSFRKDHKIEHSPSVLEIWPEKIEEKDTGRVKRDMTVVIKFPAEEDTEITKKLARGQARIKLCSS